VTRHDQALPVAGVVDVASDLQDLVTIGTHRIAAFTYMHLYHSDLCVEPEPGGPRRQQAVRLLVPWHARQEASERKLHTYGMAFTFDELGGIDGVARWMTVARDYRSMLGRVMNTRYVKMLVEDRFLHRVTALEALHRKWKGTNSTTLVTRLAQLCDLAGKPIAKLLPDVNAWCEKAKDERNNLAHHYGRTIHLDSTELLYSSEVAYWLFVLCLLRLADAPNAVFDHITANPDFGWLRERLK
jgi:Apea-like HEPN